MGLALLTGSSSQKVGYGSHEDHPHGGGSIPMIRTLEPRCPSLTLRGSIIVRFGLQALGNDNVEAQS